MNYNKKIHFGLLEVCQTEVKTKANVYYDHNEVVVHDCIKVTIHKHLNNPNRTRPYPRRF